MRPLPLRSETLCVCGVFCDSTIGGCNRNGLKEKALMQYKEMAGGVLLADQYFAC